MSVNTDSTFKGNSQQAPIITLILVMIFIVSVALFHFAVIGINFLILILFGGIILLVILNYRQYRNNPLNKLEEIIQTINQINTGDEAIKIAAAVNDQNIELSLLTRAIDEMINRIRTSKKTHDIQDENIRQQLIAKDNDLQNQNRIFYKLVEDIDKRKELLRQEKEQMNTILHSIGEGVFVIDKDNNVVLANIIAAELSGYNLQEMLGKNYASVLNFVYDKDGTVNDRFIHNAIATGTIQHISHDTNLLRRDNTKVAISASVAPLKDKNGQIAGCVVVFNDVTKERDVDRMKTEFISLASHQLRTPLSAMKWFAEMLLNGDAGALNDEQKEFTDKIYQSNERMIALVNSLLNLSRIESGRIIIDPKPTNISTVVQEVIDELEVKFIARRIKPEIKIQDGIPQINVDTKLVRHVYMNLLTNALKYTPQAGQITISLSVEKDFLISQVFDNGYGIPASEQSKIFHKFFRANNVIKKQTEGTGLGLYLAKTVVESSGGKIWFESIEDKGTSFWFTLPLKGMEAKKGEVVLDA